MKLRPLHAFLAFILCHALVWTLLPTALFPNLPLDLIEALTYGPEWPLGDYKLPPLPWWLVEIAYRTFGHDFAYYLLAQVAVSVTFALVWAFARPLVGGAGALVAVLILDGLHYFNFTAVKFNHDVLQLPFWALAGFSFYRAIRIGALKYWVMLGAAFGLAFWTKYFVVILVAPFVVFILVNRTARATLSARGPYVAAAVALAISAPHLVWLFENDFLPFAYVDGRAELASGLIDHIWHPADFAFGQLAFLLPALLISAPLLFQRKAASHQKVTTFDFAFVTTLAFGPFAALMLLSAVTGRGALAMWGYPLWSFLGVWLVLVARDERPLRLTPFLAIWAAVFLGYGLAFVADYTVLPAYDHRYRAEFYPGREVAQQIESAFTAATGQPLHYVIGSMWLGGNLAHYAASQPRVLIDGRPDRAPWIDLSDLKKTGAAVVWSLTDRTELPAKYEAIAANAVVQKPLRLRNWYGDRVVTVGWAILYPDKFQGPAPPHK